MDLILLAMTDDIKTGSTNVISVVDVKKLEPICTLDMT